MIKNVLFNKNTSISLFKKKGNDLYKIGKYKEAIKEYSKLLKIDFNTDLTGIGTNGIGSVDLTGVNAGIGSTTVGFTTTTIAQFSKTDFNSLYATIFVQDSVTKEINYNEVIVDFDGVDTTIAETYVDTQSGLSNSAVGVITARFENDSPLGKTPAVSTFLLPRMSYALRVRPIGSKHSMAKPSGSILR